MPKTKKDDIPVRNVKMYWEQDDYKQEEEANRGYNSSMGATRRLVKGTKISRKEHE